MAEKNETVTIELTPAGRMKLEDQLSRQMLELAGNVENIADLDLGCELPGGWPVDKGTEVTLAQLTVLACKLKMRIEICDLNMSPVKKES